MVATWLAQGQMQDQAASWYEWLSQDPTGRLVGAGLLAVVALIVLVILVKSMKWAAARSGMFIGIGVVLALGYLGAIWLFSLGPMGWIVAGVVAFGAFIGLALFMTHGK